MSTSEEEIGQSVERLCLELTREALRSPQLHSFHADPRALYSFLGDYFARMSDQFHREDEMAIDKRGALFVLRDIYEVAKLTDESNQYQTALRQLQVNTIPDSDSDLDVLLSAVGVSPSGPFMSQRSLREKLQASKVNIAALSEALELCRLLDSKFGITVPFGQVNLTHFAAMYCTLRPAASLFELVETLFEALPPTTQGGPAGSDGRPGTARGTPLYRASDLNKIQLLYCWAAIDDVNAVALRELCRCILRRPNLTIPLLVEVMPSLRHMHTPSYDHAAAVDSAATGTIAVYDDDDELVGSSSNHKNTLQSHHGDTIGIDSHHRDDADDEEEDADEHIQLDETSRTFWSALVAGPPDNDP